MTVRCVSRVCLPLLQECIFLDCYQQHKYFVSSEQVSQLLYIIDGSLVEEIIDVGKLWEHIPIVGWMIMENKRCGELRIGTHLKDKQLKESSGECVDEIDKLAELIGKMNRSILMFISLSNKVNLK
ncbi:hypothetical protein Tco_1409209 [Tanacetum coccineum]